MAAPRLNLRVAVLQFNPKIGQVQDNITRARDLCSKLQPKTLDLLCFPEMAFTGYVFDSATAISPYLEEPRTGTTSLFCAELAKNLECYVVAGYPEKLRPDEIEPKTEGSTHAVGANSAVMYGPDGQWVGGYRKTNLFETDMSWAKAGTGFATFQLPPPLQTVTLGICMDLNPRPEAIWDVKKGPYEIADHCIRDRTNLLVLLNSWLRSPETDPSEAHDWDTLEYWSLRLRPLWVKDATSAPDSEDTHSEAMEVSEDPLSPAPNGPAETIVVVCNRTGTENGKTFAGSSAIFSARRNSGEPRLLDMMEKDEEGIKIWSITI